MFHWREFLDKHNIPYVPKGGAHVEIRCPFCGDADPSHHMAISTSINAWKCWRQPLEHAGYNPARLVRQLINCSPDEANMIVGRRLINPDNFAERVNELLSPTISRDLTPMTMPGEFRPLNDGRTSSRPFKSYMKERGYNDAQIAFAIRQFNLRYCVTGPMKGRLIFPIYMGGDLVNCTGRTIHPSVELRYRTLRNEPSFNLPTAALPISQTLLFYDQCRERKGTICLCEGPFDALKVMTLGHNFNVAATCFFTAMPSAHQINLLHDLLPRYKKRLVLLDQTALPQMMRVAQTLSSLDVKCVMLPTWLKDPAEISRSDQLLQIIS